LRQDALQQSSATRIQSAVRNRRATNETIKRAKEKQENNAATKIQTAVRNHNALNETMKRAKQKNQENQINETLDNLMENMKKQDAASTIQKAIKSKKARSELKQKKELKTISDTVVNDMQNQIRKQQEPFINAASTIQRAVKGNKARKAMKQENLSLDVEKTIRQQKAKQLLSQIQARSDIVMRPKEVKPKPPRYIPPHIEETQTQAQYEASIRAVLRKVEATEEPLYRMSQSSDKAAVKLQNAIRNRNAKRDMMKQRQLVGEEQLKQMEETQRQIAAAKADTAKKEDIAAKQLQAVSKRIKAQNDVSKIYQAKGKIGAAAKRLLTEKVDPHYINKIKKTVIMNKPTAGQRLVVNKKLKLVSKKRHDAGVFGYETRQDFLDLAQQYKPIMTGGKK
jgi:hypothetical protein